MAFAKLFGEGDNQVLVKIDTSDEGCPEVRFFFKPEGLGVCSQALEYEDSDGGWDKAEEAFAKVDERMAMQMAESCKNWLLSTDNCREVTQANAALLRNLLLCRDGYS